MLLWVRYKSVCKNVNLKLNIAAILLCIFFIQPRAKADGIRSNNEMNYLSSDNKTKIISTDETAHTDFLSVKQRYNLDILKTIYPDLILKGGVFYQATDTISSFSETESERGDTILRPFADLNLETTLFRAGVGYRKIQMDQSADGGFHTENEKEEINSLLEWKPVDLPETSIRFSNIHSFNNLGTQDSVYKQLNINTQYTAWKKLRLNYFYNRSKTLDDVGNNNFMEQVHNGSIDYSHLFYDNRISMNTSYRVRYNSLSFSESGNILFPLPSSAGYSSIDDDADKGEFTLNNMLIDGEKDISAGLNIGLNGDETTLTHIMTDFGYPVSTDKIYVSIDRYLPPAVANSFSWVVYSSPGTISPTEWRLLPVSGPVIFSEIENRFEITIPETTSRFIKVVVRPIALSSVHASEFPDILITEMEGLNTIVEEFVKDGIRNLDQNYNMGLNWNVSKRTRCSYHFSFRNRKEDMPDQERTEYSNGVYFNQVITDKFNVNTNILRTESRDSGLDSVNYTFSASLRAVYLDTLSQTLTYSGLRETNEEGNFENNSFILRTNAKLYKGIDTFMDNGFSSLTSINNDHKETIFVRTGANIVPNGKISLNANYTYTRILNDGYEDSGFHDSQWDFQIFFTPYRVLSMNADFSIVKKNSETVSYRNYSVNWLPFPDGALQFFFVYTESMIPEDKQKDRVINPMVQWKISRHLNMNISYTASKSHTVNQESDMNSFNVVVRLVF